MHGRVYSLITISMNSFDVLERQVTLSIQYALINMRLWLVASAKCLACTLSKLSMEFRHAADSRRAYIVYSLREAGQASSARGAK